MKCSLGISNFPDDISSFPFYSFPLFLCTVHLGRLSCLSLLFSGTLRAVGSIFPFLPCLSLLFFSQACVRSPQTTTYLLEFLFLWGGFGHRLLYNITNLCP